MTSNNTCLASALALTALLAISGGCTKDNGTANSGVGTPPFVAPLANLPNSEVLTPITGPNVMALTVNGSTCASGSYPNKPCVSVTVCTPGTTTCQTIDDILLDTGSYGLRIFKSVLTVTPTPITGGGNQIAECVQFGDGSAIWGPVAAASLVLGGEAAISVPMQIGDSTYGKVPGTCGTPLTSPSEAGFNGILGVGLMVQDCGSSCVGNANNQMYYACTGSTCTGTSASLANQVTNPVALLPKDNNGVIVELPILASGSAQSVSGYLVLGIGTQTNNTPIIGGAKGVTAFAADPNYGEFNTNFNGNSNLSSFIDSGSNGFFFSDSALAVCSDQTSWFCPSSTSLLSAINTSSSGSPSSTVQFQVGDFDSFVNSNDSVFSAIGGVGGGGQFDWGLPFYLGRNVYVGFESKTSSLGTGPYWAY